MAGGKTYWWAKDAAWIDRDSIVELGEAHGPGGPLVIDVLCGMAKLENDAGRVYTGFRTLARKAFIDDVEKVREIVGMAAELGALDDLELDDDGRRFACRISGWRRDQEKGRSSERKARERQSRSVTPRNGVSRSVTPSHASVGDRTAQDRTNPSNPTVDSKIENEQALALFEHWRQACNHPTSKFTADRRRKVLARLKDGYTPEQITAAIDGAAAHAFVNDSGHRFDDLELICRTGSKLEQFIGRGAKAPAPGRTADRMVEANRRQREAAAQRLGGDGE